MKVEALSRQFIEEHPRDAARVFEQFDNESSVDYLNTLSAETVAGLFQHLSPSVVSACLALMDAGDSARILRELGIERASIYLRRMKKRLRNPVLEHMPAYYASMLRLVLRYPNGTVGQLMDPDVITVNQQTRVKTAIDFIRDNSDRLENEIYVVNEQQRLQGVVDIKDLITAVQDEAVMNIMQRPRYSIPARSRLHNIGSITGNNYRDVYPVVDHNNHFIGILRHEILTEAYGGKGPGRSDDADLAAGLLVMADLFWKTFLNLLIPDYDKRERRGRDE